MPATKEFKTYEEQLEVLNKRDLKFRSKTKAIQILQKYNYFDLINGFETILLESTGSPKKYIDVYFEDFYSLYAFDMKLKSLLLSKIFDFESRLRTSIAYNFSNAHCKNIKDIMNYTDSSKYTPPPITDTYLTKKFNNFDLFRSTPIKKNGKVVKQAFIDELKREKQYIDKYTRPPFWVVIKSLPMGSLYYTYIFLDQKVKDCVLKDFDLNSSDAKVLEQAIYVLKELRNDCAHLELVTRFRKQKTAKMNFFNDLTTYSNLSKSDINLLDCIKILKLFMDVSDVKKMIFKFYYLSVIKGRRKIANKILGKMGRKDLMTWMRI